MGVRGTSVPFSWVLLVALSAFVWVEQSYATEESCPAACTSESEEFCLMPETGNAAATGSIDVNPGHVVQDHDEMCETFPHDKYRTADGTCNHIFNYGASLRPVRRLLPHAYGAPDCLGAPRTLSKFGTPLPPATDVSRLVHPDKPVSCGFTFMLMQWGQFIDHDMTAFPITSEENSNMKCCGPNGGVLPFNTQRDCFPILLSDDDKRFAGKCMEFSRSVAARDKLKKKLSPREQMNSVTSFIDGSMVYGSTKDLQDNLRVKTADGLQAELRMTEPNGINLLPNNGLNDCTKESGSFCFQAGDTRVNEQPGLMAMHTVFARLHNIVVKGLQGRTSISDPEEIFQTARKIVGAIIQNIQFNEWLPVILGKATLDRYQLRTGDNTIYNPTVDTRIANAFSTAAFRFGHSLIPASMTIANEQIPFRKLFGKTELLFTNFAGVLKALTASMTQAEKRDRFFSEEITGHLFEMEDKPRLGLDLVALNIQRGRDHGLPSYNHYRKLCGLPILEDFKDFKGNLSKLYRDVYQSPEDIDLFSGLLTEENLDGAMVGETLACLLGLQFHALKFGDRYYFERENTAEGFTTAQLKNLRKISLADVLCQMDEIDRIQPDVFQPASTTGNNRVTNCRRMKFVKYGLWGST